LIIEIDRDSHIGKEEYDAARDEYLKSQGQYVLRIKDKDVKFKMGNVLEMIEETVKRIQNCKVVDLR
jgi:very-short-patch-repair endonuclease